MKFRLITIYFLVTILLSTSVATAQNKPAEPPKQTLESDLVTPAFAKEFQADYLSFSPARIMKWITPERGFVEDGILLTFEDTQARMKDLQNEMKEIQKPEIVFLKGYYNADFNSQPVGSAIVLQGEGVGAAPAKKFYKAFYQVTFTVSKMQQRINLIAVFEKINSKWYLVQTQNLRMSRGSSSSQKTDSLGMQTNALAIGDRPLDFEGKTLSPKPRRFASEMAKKRMRPVLLNFFARVSGDFGAQMEWAQKLYPKFKDKNIYIFCVSDDTPQFLTKYINDGNYKVSVLLDENSLMHHDLEIDIHPYIMLLDHNGVVRTMSRGYNKSSLGLVEKLMNEIIDEANRDIAMQNPSGPPIHK